MLAAIAPQPPAANIAAGDPLTVPIHGTEAGLSADTFLALLDAAHPDDAEAGGDEGDAPQTVAVVPILAPLPILFAAAPVLPAVTAWPSTNVNAASALVVPVVGDGEGEIGEPIAGDTIDDLPVVPPITSTAEGRAPKAPPAVEMTAAPHPREPRAAVPAFKGRAETSGEGAVESAAIATPLVAAAADVEASVEKVIARAITPTTPPTPTATPGSADAAMPPDDLDLADSAPTSAPAFSRASVPATVETKAEAATSRASRSSAPPIDSTVVQGLPPSIASPLAVRALAPPPVTPHQWTAETGDAVMQQVVQTIRWQWSGASGGMQIRLQPEYLGAVSIDLLVDRGEVRAAVTADTAAVRQWIESHSTELRAALSGQSLVLTELVVRDEEPPRERRQPADAEPKPSRPFKNAAPQPIFEVLA